MYGLETWKKRQKAELDFVELKKLGFSLRVTRNDGIRSEYIRAKIGHLLGEVRQARFRRFGHVPRSDVQNIDRTMLRMGSPQAREKRNTKNKVHESS